MLRSAAFMGSLKKFFLSCLHIFVAATMVSSSIWKRRLKFPKTALSCRMGSMWQSAGVIETPRCALLPHIHARQYKKQIPPPKNNLNRRTCETMISFTWLCGFFLFRQDNQKLQLKISYINIRYNHFKHRNCGVIVTEET